MEKFSKNLYKKIENSISKHKKEVEKRIKEFEEIGKSKEKTFQELCFCLLTANYSAKKAIEIQEKLGEGFLNYPQEKLSKALRDLGYRYPNIRASFIVEARRKRQILEKLPEDDREAREFIVKNIKGLGFKEGSHFLRNIGRKNLAIIDFHIIDVLSKHKVIPKIEKGKLSKTKYLEIEEVLKKISEDFSISLAELDLYLWAIETGIVLK